METTVNQITTVEHELVITGTADELSEEMTQALRAQRARTTTKGFRPGKVPLSLVKRMYGKAIAYSVAEKKVQETYNAEVLENETYSVVGQPVLTELEVDVDTELRAVIRFGTTPQVDLKSIDDVTVPRLRVDVEESAVDEQIEAFRKDHAELTPSDEPAGEKDQVVIDVQEIDAETGSPIVGKRHEDQALFLDEVTESWREGLLGKKAGETARVEVAHGEDHVHVYEAAVKEVKRRELPELDDAMVGELSEDRFSSVDELREAIRKEMKDQVGNQSREVFEGALVTVMLERHPVEVPFSAVDLYLDSFVEDVKRQNKGKLPADFDEASFRESNRAEAERQARWMFIRDRYMEEHGIEVTDEEMDTYFEEQATNEAFDAAMMRQYYDQLGVTERVRQQMLSRKVFDRLAADVSVEETDTESYGDAMKTFNERYLASPQPASAE
jgi:trigger factor